MISPPRGCAVKHVAAAGGVKGGWVEVMAVAAVHATEADLDGGEIQRPKPE